MSHVTVGPGRMLLAGIAGTVAISALFEGSNALLGTGIDLQPALGAAFTGHGRHGATRPLGAAIHFLVGAAVLPAGYELAFRLLGRRGATTGAALGLVHGLASGGSLPLMESRHPAKGTIPEHGLLAREAGDAAPAVFVLGHVVYGAVLGALMKPRRKGVERIERSRLARTSGAVEGSAIPVAHTATDRARDERALGFAPERPD